MSKNHEWYSVRCSICAARLLAPRAVARRIADGISFVACDRDECVEACVGFAEIIDGVPAMGCQQPPQEAA